ncbi:MAG: hypothetical protein D3910_28070 [Candidatus Electrothrix sp. ATG2]|nr:hypothetical protein [Candidatus Electrothrix sp. ATG2]
MYKSHQFVCVKRAMHGITVMYDLHWRLNNDPRFARAILWEEAFTKAVPVSALAGCRTLHPEHALLLAVLHRAGTLDVQQDRLIWLYDIYLLLSGMSDMEMVNFAQRAVRKNVQQSCLEAVRKVQDCFPVKVPEQVLDLLSLPLQADSVRERFTKSYLGLISDDLCSLPHPKMRLALLRELLFPTADELFCKYGKGDSSSARKKILLPVLFGRYLVQGLVQRIFYLR